MNDGKGGACAPYEVLSKCEIGGIEYFPASEDRDADVVCLNQKEWTFLRACKAVGDDPSTKNVTKRRLETSGCAGCGQAPAVTVDA
jgi:hypothetical protein